MRTSQIPHATGAVSFVFEDETLRIFLDYVSEPYIVVTEKLPTSRSFVLEARWTEHCWSEHLGEPEVLQAIITDDSKWVAHLDDLYEKAVYLPVQDEETQIPQPEHDSELLPR